MSERGFLKLTAHVENGWLWAKIECAHGHVPCSVNAPLEKAALWVADHVREFHYPKAVA